MFKISAAPPRPKILPLQSFKTLNICALSISSSVLTSELFSPIAPVFEVAIGSSISVIVSPSVSRIDLSSKCSNSLMFPGQSYACNWFSAAVEIDVTEEEPFLPYL